MWIGSVIARLDRYLSNELREDLEEIASILRVGCEITDILRAVEKYFGKTANYAKGKGSIFDYYMNTYHQSAYLYPVSRACGGSRQDIGVEGAIAVLMNLPYYLEFLMWRYRCGGNGILEKKLYLLLRSVEMVGLLRVLSILYISVCMLMRWLAGNCGELEDYNFGVADMPEALDLMDVAFGKVADDGDLLLDEDFMMGLFEPLLSKISPFQDYMTYMFDEKRANLVGSNDKDDRIFPFQLLKDELWDPTRKDIVQSNTICAVLATESAEEFQIQFRCKATGKYCKAIQGAKSLADGGVSEQERIAGRGIDATNSISESLHASSTHGLKVGGTIRLDHCAAEGQTRANNDFGRQHLSLVSGRASKVNADKELGTFHSLPPELQRTAMLVAKENASNNRQRFDNALKKQFAKRQMKEEIGLRKQYENATEEYVVAIYFYEQYHSPRCWLTEKDAKETYLKLGNESARLAAVKEQILIRYLGLGWVEAHHAWSHNNNTFTSRALMKHLVDVVIPLSNKLNVPPEPPVNVPDIPEMGSLGTVSELADDVKKFSDDKITEIREKAGIIREEREKKGDGDRWFERNQLLPPEILKLIGFRVEMLFAYNGDDGTQCLGWYQGTVQSILNENNRRVRIKWDEECLGEGDVRVSNHKLMRGNWNPKVAKKGGWRENLVKK